MTEFRISTGWRIFSVLLAAALLFGGIFLLAHSLSPVTSGQKIPLFVMGLVLIPFAVFLFVDSTVTRLTIDDYSMTLKRAFSSRSVDLKDIDGYRVGKKNYIYIILKEGGKRMRLSPNLERQPELIEWLKGKYPDVDAVEFEKETQDILEDDRFGLTKEERESRLAKARRVMRNFSILSILVMGWMIVYPNPFEILMMALLLIPWAGVYFVWQFKGLLKLSGKKGSAYPSALLFLSIPIFALLVGVLRGYDLYSFPGSSWQILAGMSVVATIVFAMICKDALAEEKIRLLSVSIIFVFAAVYCYGLLVFSNCYYDRSVPQQWRVEITGKHVSHGKSTSYHLDLSSWGRFEDGKSITVSRSFYQTVDRGDSLSVFLQQGKWNIPWYRVVRQ